MDKEGKYSKGRNIKSQKPRAKKNDKHSVYDVIAEKLLSKSNLYVLDFEENPIKEVFIDRINYNNRVLKFKQPIKLLIEKINEGFSISQSVFGIRVVDKPFSRAIGRFQREFYISYTKTKQERENGLNILYNSIIDKTKS